MVSRITPLSGELKNIFETEKALTEYAQTHPIDLKNILIKDHDISHTTLLKGRFTNTHWDDVVYQYANISNVTFKGGSIYDMSFARSILTNVVFEDMEMEKIEFIGATLINVTFINCKIYNSNFGSLKTSKILIENSKLNNINFFQSNLNITVKNTEIVEQGGFRSLKSGSKVVIENSYIGKYSEFDHSNLLSFTMKNSTVVDSKMNDAIIDEIVIENSKINFPIANGKLNKVIMRNINSVILGESTINSLIIEDCKEDTDILLFETVFKSISIRNCPTDRITLRSAKGEKIAISNMHVRRAEFGKLITKELTMNNITINGIADFSGALAEESLVTNFSIKQGTKVSMDGTNIKFQ